MNKNQTAFDDGFLVGIVFGFLIGVVGSAILGGIIFSESPYGKFRSCVDFNSSQYCFERTLKDLDPRNN